MYTWKESDHAIDRYVLYISIKSHWLSVLSLLIFCPVFLSLIERGVSQVAKYTMDCSFPFQFVTFCFRCYPFEALLKEILGGFLFLRISSLSWVIFSLLWSLNFSAFNIATLSFSLVFAWYSFCHFLLLLTYPYHYIRN